MGLNMWLKSLFKSESIIQPTTMDMLNPMIDDSKKSSENLSVFHRLDVRENAFYVTQKSPYKMDGVLKPQTIDKVFDFAYKMAFSSEGEHRSRRSGGDHTRRNGEIFANTFQGKIAECAACNYFYKFDKNIIPDFSVYKLGKWDTCKW